MPDLGDAFKGQASVDNNNYLTIQPAEGYEATIMQIWANGGGKLKVSVYDGSTEAVLVDLSSAGGDAWPVNGNVIPVTYGQYARVQNLSGSAMVIGYAGYYTKVPAA